MVDVSIIILSWNVEQYVRECLESIYQALAHADAPSVEIILVDSASSDNTLEIVQQSFPDVHILAQTENIGFTRGNNIGMEAARGRYLFVLNPDTVILGDAITKMVEYMDGNPDIGIVGPYTLNTDGSTQSTRRRFPTVTTAYFESTWLQPFAPRRVLDHYYVNDLPQQATVDVDWVQGSAMMVQREVYEQIGGFDTDYFMFSEELDWCKRAKLAGWRVVFLCTAQIIHHGGKSTEQATASKHIHFQQSKLRYFRKYHGKRVAARLRLFLLANYYVQIILESFKHALGSKQAMRQARIAVYREVIHSGLKVT